jgi:hypothetical protein
MLQRLALLLPLKTILASSQVGSFAAGSGYSLTLDLSGSTITDLKPLRRLYSLRELDVSRTQVVNLSPISGLVYLETLNITCTQVTDLTPLSQLRALTSVDYDGTHLQIKVYAHEDVDRILSYCPGCTKFTLTLSREVWGTAGSVDSIVNKVHQIANRIPEINFKFEVGNSNDIEAAYRVRNTLDNRVRSIVFVGGIKSLLLSGPEVTNLSPLSGLVALEELHVKNTQVEYCNLFRYLPWLRFVDWHGNHLEVKLFAHEDVDRILSYCPGCRAITLTLTPEVWRIPRIVNSIVSKVNTATVRELNFEFEDEYTIDPIDRRVSSNAHAQFSLSLVFFYLPVISLICWL